MTSLPRLVIAGASGVVGRHLTAAARGRYDITVLTRRIDGSEAPGATAVAWKPRAARDGDEVAIDALAATIDGAAGLVNLAGVAIDDGRLGPEHRRRVTESRVDSSTTLVAAVERCARPPTAWFQIAGTTYYGDRGDEVLTEAAPPAGDAMARVALAWEAAAAPAAARCRLSVGRTGMVLADDAPAWRKYLLPIRWFVGGPLGSGRQFLPWIHADDLASAILFILEHPEGEGVFNLVASEPSRQIELTRAAARRLGRPALLPVPPFALRLVLGGLADALLLASARMVPERLQELDFVFRYPDLEAAMDDLLGSS